MKYFLKLIRTKNLLVILLTMIGVAYYVIKSNDYQKVDFHYMDYCLLMFSTLIIAAAGNVINDYFDVKADRINKPEKVIISKFMKPRWAILWHWTFNLLAFLIAIYLSVKYATLLFVFVHLLSINLLWFYSVQLKKKLLISNLIIAFLTALVPLLSVWFFKVLNESGIKTKLIWQTAVTEASCGVCVSLNGLAQGDGWTELPPLHPYCRCTVKVEREND